MTQNSVFRKNNGITEIISDKKSNITSAVFWDETVLCGRRLITFGTAQRLLLQGLCEPSWESSLYGCTRRNKIGTMKVV
jgi:hypothetical protein